jgi:hypothetical protein
MTDLKSNLMLKATYLVTITAFLLYLSLISCTTNQRVVNFVTAISLWLVGFVFGVLIGIQRRVMRR